MPRYVSRYVSQQSAVGTHQINLCLMAHETDHRNVSVQRIGSIYESGATINIVPPQSINERLNRFEGAFMKDEVTRKDMHYVP